MAAAGRWATALSCVVLLFLMLQASSLIIEPDWDMYAIYIESEPAYRHMDWKYYHGQRNYSCPCIKDSIETRRGCFKVEAFKSEFLASVQVIEEYLMPFVEREKFNILSKCILHPDNNRFMRPEKYSKCGFCPPTLSGIQFSKILMDYEDYYTEYGRSAACDVLQCYLVMNCRMKDNKIELNSEEVVKNRQLCESLANSCFPANEGPSENQLHELLLRQVCDAHTYSGRPEPPIIEMKKHASNMYLAILVSILLLLIFRLGGYLHKRKHRKRDNDKEAVRKRRRVTKKPYPIVGATPEVVLRRRH